MKNEKLQSFLILGSVVMAFALVVMSKANQPGADFGRTMTYLLSAVVAAAYGAVTAVGVARARQSKLREGRIFILYDDADIGQARALAAWLRERGYRPWVRADELAAGQRIDATSENEMEMSAATLVLVSRHFDLNKTGLAKALRRALAQMQSHDALFSGVIPLKLDDTEVPPSLRDLYAVNLNGVDGYASLERGLHCVLDERAA